MQLYEKLALIQHATKQFDAVREAAQRDDHASFAARREINLAKAFDLHDKPYCRMPDGYYGWTGKNHMGLGITPTVQFMFD